MIPVNEEREVLLGSRLSRSIPPDARGQGQEGGGPAPFAGLALG